jgi:hypothetical protein
MVYLGQLVCVPFFQVPLSSSFGTTATREDVNAETLGAFLAIRPHFLKLFILGNMQILRVILRLNRVYTAIDNFLAQNRGIASCR